MARYNEYDRGYRDYDVRDRFLDEGNWETRDRDYGWRSSERDWDREYRGLEGRRRADDYIYGGYPRVTPYEYEAQHHGRGPKGWRRADARIEDEVYERLTRHGYLDATDIEVEVKDAEVTLKGKVRSKEEKRLAEDLVDDVLGVQDVHNKLKVNEDAGIVHGHEETVRKVIEPGR